MWPKGNYLTSLWPQFHQQTEIIRVPAHEFAVPFKQENAGEVFTAMSGI